TGEIPKELGQLTKLTVLSLFGNQLTGEIPKELGRFENVTILSLRNNQLNGNFTTCPFVPPFDPMLHLIVPWPLLNSVETGKLPKELGSLTKL
ncbi:unnamed protein product, partial [Phaeothamnion confervicola]